jgi:uncharacterized protein YdiU (UPF0061 family)
VAKNRSDVKKLVLENREMATQLHSNQALLFDSTQTLQKDKDYCQRLSIKEAELKKSNEQLEEQLRQLTDTLQEEKESYTRIITHMRQSIQQDEQAIEGLVKQATLIETMIN